ncbi:MAG: prealbumin-like fold domain-containing protein [Bacilli bacterium]|nr:prealbumin-like fold domain-containing protein [Bacilli bacterium]
MKKVIFLFLAIFLMKTNVIAKEFIDNEYLNIYFNGIYEGNIISDNFMYKEHEGIPVYCIDFSLPISVDEGYEISNFSDYKSLTVNQRIYIELISFFGYKYYNRNDIYYYLATQELIWSSLGVDTYWTYSQYGNNPINLDQYKLDILNTYSDYLNENYNFDEYYSFEIGNSYYIEYPKTSLPNYEYYYSGINNVVFDEYGITFNANYKTSTTIVLLRNFDRGYESKVFIEPGYQTIVKTGSLKSKKKTLNINVNNIDIYLKRINLGDTNNKYLQLNSAIYEIYDGNMNYIQNAITDEYGDAIIPNLPLGSYVIKEIQSSYGFEPYEENIYKTLDWGLTYNIIEVEVKPITKKISITNLYRINGIDYFDSNIKFNIYRDGNLIEELSTNNEGYVSTFLEYGNYQVTQVTSREDFELEPLFEIVINEFDNKLDYIFIKERNIETEDIRINEDIEEENIEINNENNQEELIDSINQDNIENIVENIPIEQINITTELEYEEKIDLDIKELPQLYENKNILEIICESLFVFLFYY